MPCSLSKTGRIQRPVIEYIIKYGAKYGIGLEVGTKAELLAALSLGLPREALLICNGYKDEDYLRLALSIHNVNNIVIVVDLFEEIFDILKYAGQMGIAPRLGMRIKLFSRGSGRWVESGGEAATQLVGNHTEANVNNPSENLEVWRAGQVRANAGAIAFKP